MGKRTQSAKEFLTAKKVTPLGVVTLLAGLFYFIMLETDLFKGMNDILKVAIYAAIMAFGIITGIKPIQFKKFAQNVKEIVKDRSMSPEMKVQKLLNLALPILSELGEAHELLNMKQFEQIEEGGDKDAGDEDPEDA